MKNVKYGFPQSFLPDWLPVVRGAYNSTMDDASQHAFRHAVVPLFPLPNVVLLPTAILPLHIFEERYKTMTRHALAGDRLIAMALLTPGWEKDYYQKPAIEPIVCVGTIVSHEQLPDGKFNLLLQGHTRARIVREVGDELYRQAQINPLRDSEVLEIDLSDQRARLLRSFSEGPLASSPIAHQFVKMIDSPMRTDKIADLVAFNFIESIEIKQRLLAENDVRKRVELVLAVIEKMNVQIDPSLN